MTRDICQPYSLIPWNVQTLPGFTQVTSLLYSTIQGLSRKTGYCYATNEYLAKTLNVTRRRIQQILARLKRLNLVSVRLVTNGIQTLRKIFLKSPDSPRVSESNMIKEIVRDEAPYSPPPEIKKSLKYEHPTSPGKTPLPPQKNKEILSNEGQLSETPKSFVHNLFKKSLKYEAPYSPPPEAPYSPILLKSDKEEIALEKAIGKPSARHRSFLFPKDSSLSDPKKQASYDWDSFRLENGKRLSPRMRLAFQKYKPWEMPRLLDNIEFYQIKCRKGYSPKNHEAFLQQCINCNFAAEQRNIANNRMMAEVFIEDHNITDYEFRKTSVLVKVGKKWISLSLMASPDEFDAKIRAIC